MKSLVGEGRQAFTLTGDFNAVIDLDGLAVVDFFLGAFAEAGVVEVLKMRHGV